MLARQQDCEQSVLVVRHMATLFLSTQGITTFMLRRYTLCGGMAASPHIEEGARQKKWRSECSQGGVKCRHGGLMDCVEMMSTLSTPNEPIRHATVAVALIAALARRLTPYSRPLSRTWSQTQT